MSFGAFVLQAAGLNVRYFFPVTIALATLWAGGQEIRHN